MRNLHLYMVFTFICFIMLACAAQQDTSMATKVSVTNTFSDTCPEILPTPSPLPKFLEWIYPTNSITKDEYQNALLNKNLGGITITVNADGIDRSVFTSKDIDYRVTTMSERITIFVDERLTPNDLSTIGDGLVRSGPFYFSWAVKLDAGYHTAKLVFNLDTGETVNYEWSFCITP